MESSIEGSFYVLNFICIPLNINCYLSFKNGRMSEDKKLSSNRSEHLLDFEDYFKEKISYRTYLWMSAFESNDEQVYKDSVRDMVYDDDEPYRYNNQYYRWPKEENQLFEQWLHLVKENIKWKRKWSEAPLYLHSIRVCDKLFIYWYSKDVWLAWLLHDMIEDWEYTLEQLKDLWYSDRTVELVDLCSHDKTIEDSFERWEWMVKRLIEAKDKEAWAIKICDMMDNLTEVDLMSRDKLERFLFKKAPVYVYYGNEYFWGSGMYSHFLARYHNQVCRFYWYEL